MGGTSLKALVVDGHNKILALEKTPTHRSKRPDRLIADIAKLVEKAWKRAGLKRSKIRAVSIGAPGAVDHGKPRRAPLTAPGPAARPSGPRTRRRRG